jgi:hypothetical protein
MRRLGYGGIKTTLWLAFDDHVQADVPKYAHIAFVVKGEPIGQVNAPLPHVGHTLDTLYTPNEGWRGFSLNSMNALAAFA